MQRETGKFEIKVVHEFKEPRMVRFESPLFAGRDYTALSPSFFCKPPSGRLFPLNGALPVAAFHGLQLTVSRVRVVEASRHYFVQNISYRSLFPSLL